MKHFLTILFCAFLMACGAPKATKSPDGGVGHELENEERAAKKKVADQEHPDDGDTDVADSLDVGANAISDEKPKKRRMQRPGRAAWAVARFKMAEEWNASGAKLEERDWGGELARKVKARLTAQGKNAEMIEELPKSAEVRAEMVKAGMRYACTGKILSLKQVDKQWQLATKFVARRNTTGDKLVLITGEKTQASVPAEGSPTTAMDKLLDVTADRIATRLIDRVGEDLTASGD